MAGGAVGLPPAAKRVLIRRSLASGSRGAPDFREPNASHHPGSFRQKILQAVSVIGIQCLEDRNRTSPIRFLEAPRIISDDCCPGLCAVRVAVVQAHGEVAVLPSLCRRLRACCGCVGVARWSPSTEMAWLKSGATFTVFAEYFHDGREKWLTPRSNCQQICGFNRSFMVGGQTSCRRPTFSLCEAHPYAGAACHTVADKPGVKAHLFRP